jgi:hypothetical protein
MVVEQLQFVTAQAISFVLYPSIRVATVRQSFTALHLVHRKRQLDSIRSSPNHCQTLQRSIHQRRMKSILVVTPFLGTSTTLSASLAY